MNATDEEAEITGASPDIEEVAADPALLAQGWERRSLTDPGRVDEVRELYTSLGFEVLVQPLTRDDFDRKCGSCAETACTAYVLVYTRRSGD